MVASLWSFIGRSSTFVLSLTLVPLNLLPSASSLLGKNPLVNLVGISGTVFSWTHHWFLTRVSYVWTVTPDFIVGRMSLLSSNLHRHPVVVQLWTVQSKMLRDTHVPLACYMSSSFRSHSFDHSYNFSLEPATEFHSKLVESNWYFQATFLEGLF